MGDAPTVEELRARIARMQAASAPADGRAGARRRPAREEGGAGEPAASGAPAPSEVPSRGEGPRRDGEASPVPPEGRACAKGGGAKAPGADGGKRGASEKVYDAESAFRKIERVANVSEQCSYKLVPRLVREGWSLRDAESAVARAQACLLVDDGRYLRLYLSSRLSQGKGRDGVLYDLRRLGYAEADVEAALEELAAESEIPSEVDRALRLLEARPPRSKNRHDGAYRKLLGAGYASSVASEAATRYCDRMAEEGL